VRSRRLPSTRVESRSCVSASHRSNVFSVQRKMAVVARLLRGEPRAGDGIHVRVKGCEKRCPVHSKPSRCQRRTSIDMRPSQVLSIEIRPPDSKLLQPDIHADGAVPGGRLLSRLVCVVEGNEVKKDFAAMSGLAALGGFIMRQWMNYERRSLKYGIRDRKCFLPESYSGGWQEGSQKCFSPGCLSPKMKCPGSCSWFVSRCCNGSRRPLPQ
jgi:hypothetical protein